MALPRGAGREGRHGQEKSLRSSWNHLPPYLFLKNNLITAVTRKLQLDGKTNSDKLISLFVKA